MQNKYLENPEKSIRKEGAGRQNLDEKQTKCKETEKRMIFQEMKILSTDEEKEKNV